MPWHVLLWLTQGWHVTKEVIDEETGEIITVPFEQKVLDAEGEVVIDKYMEQRSYKMKELGIHRYIVKAEMTPRQVAEMVKLELAA